MYLFLYYLPFRVNDYKPCNKIYFCNINNGTIFHPDWQTCLFCRINGKWADIHQYRCLHYWSTRSLITIHRIWMCKMGTSNTAQKNKKRRNQQKRDKETCAWSNSCNPQRTTFSQQNKCITIYLCRWLRFQIASPKKIGVMIIVQSISKLLKINILECSIFRPGICLSKIKWWYINAMVLHQGNILFLSALRPFKAGLLVSNTTLKEKREL